MGERELLTVWLDFETKDDYIREYDCSGWIYKLLDPSDTRFELIGCGLKTNPSLPPVYYTDMAAVKLVLDAADVLVAHNLEYDLGGCLVLGVDLKDKVVRDTLVGSHLYYNISESHSLDYIAGKYLDKHKLSDELGEIARRIGLVKNKRQDANQIAKSNMKLIQEADSAAVAKYCCQDVQLMFELDQFFLGSEDVKGKQIPRVERKLYEKYSSVMKVLLAMRVKGVRIDLPYLEEVGNELDTRAKRLEQELYTAYGEFNYKSPKQLCEKLVSLGMKPPKTAPSKKFPEGQLSATSKWMATQKHPICAKIIEILKLQDTKTTFIDQLRTFQRNGRVYPCMNMFGARTGRFSCKTPNIQNIPRRDEEIGPLIRKMFIPEEGETWFKLDYSSQEPRLQIHFAKLKQSELQCPDVDFLVDQLVNDPAAKIYNRMADLLKEKLGIEFSKDEIKAIMLGLGYGMGKDKFAKLLKRSVDEAQEMKKLFFRVFSYLKKLLDYCKIKIKERGWIKTIGGRVLRDESKLAGVDLSYKALNWLVQGSAADQTIEALLLAYEAGITPSVCVHDEINISARCVSVAKTLKACMENSIKLLVPSYTEIKSGRNWAEAA